MGIISLPDKTSRNFSVFCLSKTTTTTTTFHARINFLKFQVLPKVQTDRQVRYIPISTVPHSQLPFPKHPHHLSLHPSDLGVHFLLLWYLWYLQYLID